jgi:hypothetical protein
VLELDSQPVTDRPWSERRTLLETLDFESTWAVKTMMVDDGNSLFAATGALVATRTSAFTDAFRSAQAGERGGEGEAEDSDQACHFAGLLGRLRDHGVDQHDQ